MNTTTEVLQPGLETRLQFSPSHSTAKKVLFSRTQKKVQALDYLFDSNCPDGSSVLFKTELIDQNLQMIIIDPPDTTNKFSKKPFVIIRKNNSHRQAAAVIALDISQNELNVLSIFKEQQTIDIDALLDMSSLSFQEKERIKQTAITTFNQLLTRIGQLGYVWEGDTVEKRDDGHTLLSLPMPQTNVTKTKSQPSNHRGELVTHEELPGLDLNHPVDSVLYQAWLKNHVGIDLYTLKETFPKEKNLLEKIRSRVKKINKLTQEYGFTIDSFAGTGYGFWFDEYWSQHNQQPRSWYQQVLFTQWGNRLFNNGKLNLSDTAFSWNELCVAELVCWENVDPSCLPRYGKWLYTPFLIADTVSRSVVFLDPRESQLLRFLISNQGFFSAIEFEKQTGVREPDPGKLFRQINQSFIATAMFSDSEQFFIKYKYGQYSFSGLIPKEQKSL